MSDDDRTLAAVLDAVLPQTAAAGNWEEVVQATGRPRLAREFVRSVSRRRLLVVGALAIVVVLTPLTAFAVSSSWWFFNTALPVPSPVGDVVVVKQGQSDGIPWTLTAYQTQNHALCISLTPNPPSDSPATASQSLGASASSLGCGSLRGISDAPDSTTAPELTFVAATYTGTDGAEVEVVAGGTAADVAEVATLNNAGGQITAETTPAPSDLGLPIRFFAVQLPSGSKPSAVRALDANGRPLQELPIP